MKHLLIQSQLTTTSINYVIYEHDFSPFPAKTFYQRSGQVKLATVLYSSQYLFSDSLGVKPPLWL